MKKLFIAFCCMCILISCSPRSIPSATHSLNNNPETNLPADSVTNTEVEKDSVNIAPAMAVMVVADGYGRLITSKETLPQNAGVKYNALQLSKGFTPQQRSNLQARYHIIPPRVLYVSEQYYQRSLKGVYYIYRKKFWYWKKTDGLFYLDQKYYL